MNREWLIVTPTSERPADDERVVVLCRSWPGPQFGRYVHDLNEWRIEGSNGAYCVTHWMRLELPEEYAARRPTPREQQR